jgi:hypothetical protein
MWRHRGQFWIETNKVKLFNLHNVYQIIYIYIDIYFFVCYLIVQVCVPAHRFFTKSSDHCHGAPFQLNCLVGAPYQQFN